MEDIWLYTAENWSVEQADSYHADIVRVFDQLADGKRRGRSIGDLRNGYLKYAAGSHFVFYLQRNSSIDVIRILHRRMDAERHL